MPFILDKTLFTKGCGDPKLLQYKYCECHRCGTKDYNTPELNFMTRRNDPFGPLFCEMCVIAEYVQEHGSGDVRIGYNES